MPSYTRASSSLEEDALGVVGLLALLANTGREFTRGPASLAGAPRQADRQFGGA